MRGHFCFGPTSFHFGDRQARQGKARTSANPNVGQSGFEMQLALVYESEGE